MATLQFAFRLDAEVGQKVKEVMEAFLAQI